MYKSLTDTWIWKLGLRLHNSFSGNICFGFSVLVICSVPIYLEFLSHLSKDHNSDLVIRLVTIRKKALRFKYWSGRANLSSSLCPVLYDQRMREGFLLTNSIQLSVWWYMYTRTRQWNGGRPEVRLRSKPFIFHFSIMRGTGTVLERLKTLRKVVLCNNYLKIEKICSVFDLRFKLLLLRNSLKSSLFLWEYIYKNGGRSPVWSNIRTLIYSMSAVLVSLILRPKKRQVHENIDANIK